MREDYSFYFELRYIAFILYSLSAVDMDEIVLVGGELRTLAAAAAAAAVAVVAAAAIALSVAAVAAARRSGGDLHTAAATATQRSSSSSPMADDLKALSQRTADKAVLKQANISGTRWRYVYTMLLYRTSRMIHGNIEHGWVSGLGQGTLWQTRSY